MSLRDWTWSCHFCGVVKRDSLISTVRRTSSILGGRTELVETRRFCNDSAECIRAAHAWQQEPSVLASRVQEPTNP